MLECNQITAVLIANSFNLSIFQQIWLINNEIVTQDEFNSGNNFFTPAAVSVQTSEYDLLIVPDRAQLVIPPKASDSNQIIQRVIGGIIRTLPHTPYTAAGLNFTYIIKLSDPKALVEKCKNIFVSKDNPLSEDFASDDARFGIYLSVDIFGIRLRLDIKPIRLNVDGNDALQLAFNANSDSSDIESINQLLNQSKEIYDYTFSLTEKLHKKLEG